MISRTRAERARRPMRFSFSGLTESEARQSGKRILVGVRPMTMVARAIEKRETQGFIKIVVDGLARPGHCVFDAHPSS